MQNYVEKLSRPLVWGDDAEQIPYWLYQDEEIAKLEQKKIFGGPTWNYLCLEAEIPNRGDYRTTFIGEMPIIVARAEDGEVYAFENRCTHRGALIAIDNHGNTPAFSCVYHAWSYDLQGSLKGVAFQQGVDGKGGMPEDFVMQEHDPRKVRVASFCGLLFGSLDDDVPDIEDFLGPDISGRIERVLSKPIKVIGRSRQNLPNNWKLYFENVKDSYHASLLHLFFTTFRLNRLTQKGGVTVSEGGLHHVSYSAIDPTLDSNDIYSEQGIRSDNEDFRLADPSLLHGIDEIGDGVTLQILSVFPGFVLQQIRNSIAIRQVLPKGVDRTELNWTYIGFEDDSAELELMRLKQANLVGPAGYVSMEDGAVGNFVQRGIACASDRAGIIVMGGREVKSVDYRATETSVRGFWKAYRGFMEF